MDSERCYGVYHRTSDGIWLYPWGEPVPGARDVTVRDLLRLGLVHDDSDLTMEHLTDSLCADELVDRNTLAGGVDWETEEGLDRIVGLYAPELHVRAMLTMGDIADMIDVEPDTVAAYRYRGYLPEPQAVIGRTPVWSRPSSGTGCRPGRATGGARTSMATGRSTWRACSTAVRHASASDGRNTHHSPPKTECRGHDPRDRSFPPAGRHGW